MTAPLFADDPTTTLERAVRLVRDAVGGSAFAVVAETALDGGAGFRFEVAAPGGTAIEIELRGEPGVLRIVTRLGTLDPGDPRSLAALLRANADLRGLSFALTEGDGVVLTGARPIADLDPSELLDLLGEVEPAVAGPGRATVSLA